MAKPQQGAIVPYEKKVETLAGVLSANKKAITSLLPAHVKPEMLQRTIFSAVTQTPALLDCTPASILRSTLQAAQLGLPPNDGRGLSYLVPYRNKGVAEAQLITGYRGLILLARQSGDVGAVDAACVYQGDEFDYSLGLRPALHHRKSSKSAFDDKGNLVRPIIAAWCCASVKGERQFVVLEAWEIDRIRNGSQGYKAAKQHGFPTPWIDHPGPMAQKTAVRAECKLLPLSSEILGHALALDDAHDAGKAQQLGEIGEAIRDDGAESNGKPATTLADKAADEADAAKAAGWANAIERASNPAALDSAWNEMNNAYQGQVPPALVEKHEARSKAIGSAS